MEPRYSAGYIDQLIDERDSSGFHQLVSVVARRSVLPDELWAFNRVLEWIGSTRSGVWQYYEGLDPAVFARLNAWLVRVGWKDLNDRYAKGMRDVAAGGTCEDLDRWIDDHETTITTKLWSFAISQVTWLKTTADT